MSNTVTSFELRIGNLILDHEGAIRKVAYVGDTIGLYNDIGGTQKYQHNPIISGDIKDLKGVPITPEILEKCGFENNELNIVRNVSIKSTVRGKYCYCDLEYDSAYYMPEPITLYKIEYLHQLQTLYFALTGKELEIKL